MDLAPNQLQPKRLIILAVTAIIYTCAISLIGYGFDYCVNYYAVALFLGGQSPYGLAANTFLALTCETVSIGIGSAYPIPFLLIIAPMIFLPFALSAFIWTISGTLLIMLAWLLVPESPKLLLLSIVFLPCYQAISLGQSTLHWFGMCVLLILSMERRWWFVAGCCMAFLIWKPQAGLIFALAGCWWALRTERRALLVMSIITLLLLTISFIARPGWVYEWLDQIRTYGKLVPLHSYVIFVPVLVLACWKMPWWAKLAVVQALLFPVGNPYMVLPLLLIWLYIGGWTAIVGASISYLWPLLPYDIGWFTLIVPVCLAAVYHSWVVARRYGEQVTV